MENILFRADSSSSIGTGHIMRDLVLAKQFEGSEIIFATQNLPGSINHKIVEEKFKVKFLDSNNLTEVVALVKKYSIDMVVIDHYEIGYLYEEELKNETGVKILVVDDAYEKHCCDILLNHNVYADKVRYKGLVPDNCELRCGSEFTLLREEFSQARKKKISLSSRSVLIAMGGADTANKNVEILKVFEGFSQLQCNVVTTTANQGIEALKIYAESRSNVTVHVNTSEIAQLMSDADFAVLTPSVTVNEALHLGLPFISIKTADNQREMHDFLVANSYLALPVFDKIELAESIGTIVGSQTVKLVSFVNLSDLDKRYVLEWRNHPDVRKWMFSKSEIKLHEHAAFIRSLEDKCDRAYFLVRKGTESIGVVDLTGIDLLSKTAELGVYANPQLRGVGRVLMKAILNHAFEVLKLRRIISEVYVDNKPAIHLYEKCGFKNVEILSLEGLRVLRMELEN